MRRHNRRHNRRKDRATGVLPIPLMTRLVARLRPTARGHRRYLFRTLDFVWWLIDKGWAWVIGGSAAAAGILGIITKRWPIVVFARTHVVTIVLLAVTVFIIVACALAGHVLWEAAVDRDGDIRKLSATYLLTPIQKTPPELLGVAKFSDSYYASRLDLISQQDAQEVTRMVIRQAGEGQPGDPSGVYVVGQLLLGKTWLAYVATVRELPGWHVVRWPTEDSPQDLDVLLLWGERIVLWLDDLHKYSKSEAVRISTFIGRLTSYDIQHVIVGTCRDGDALERAHDEFGTFVLERLREVRPGFIGGDQAKLLSQSVDDVDPRRTWEQRYGGWDKLTPGSVLFSMVYYRNTVWPALPRHAKHIMWALQLLADANLTPYESRVRAVCDEIFDWPRQEGAEWRFAVSKLVDTHYINPPEASAVDEEAGEKYRMSGPQLDPYTDGLLKEGIEPYPNWAGDVRRGWPHLKAALARTYDANGLDRLGDKYLEQADEIKRNAPTSTSGWKYSLRRASSCYVQAIRFSLNRPEDTRVLVLACQSLANTCARLASSFGGRREKNREYERAERLLRHALRRCAERSQHDASPLWKNLMLAVQADLVSIENDPERQAARGPEGDGPEGDGPDVESEAV